MCVWWWTETRQFKSLLFVFYNSLIIDQAPVEVLLLLCIPVVDPDKEDRNWRRPLNCLHLITAPLVCVFAFQSGKCKCITFHDKGTSQCNDEKRHVAEVCFQSHVSFWTFLQMEILRFTVNFLSGCWFSCWDFSCLLLPSSPPTMTALPNITQ